MATISTDYISPTPTPAESNDIGRWGRGDFVEAVYPNIEPLQALSDEMINYGRWGRGNFTDQLPVVEGSDYYARWGRSGVFSSDITLQASPKNSPVYIYRGTFESRYIYSIGAPPPLASDVTIIGRYRE